MMSGVELTEFLLARLDEDERDAQLASSKSDGHLWVVTGPDNAVGVDYDPARVLAEVAAKRMLVEAYEAEAAVVKPFKDPWEDGQLFGLGRAVRLLALPHAEHPDYREEWKP